ncbi:MAG TPA: response regulator [Patescibacteria group bacterium]|nr:response regulator [Patescibacteria group bacterium]
MDEPTKPVPTTQSKRLLCIEDEHFISELYARALTKAGYDVKVIIDGAEGLAEAKTGHYDIILLDLMVPNLDGIQILRQLRELQPPISSKIIITTNLEEDPEHRHEIEKQADGYLIKAEITPRQLVEFLANVK